MTKVWHYAPWKYLPAMVESESLKTSNAGVPKEAGMLWFSANQHWEHTATKIVRDSAGNLFRLTFNQQAEQFGCIRFGMYSKDLRLLNWKNACAAAGTPSESRRMLEKVGKKMGADPAQWFATTTSVPLTDLHFQIWIGQWCDATSPKDMADSWINAQGT